MRVNWRRGLSRLWLAATLAWVVLAFVMFRPDRDVSTLISSFRTYSASEQPATMKELEHAVLKAHEAGDADAVRQIGREIRRLQREAAASAPANEQRRLEVEQRRAIADARKRRRINATDRLQGFALVAFAPPAFILALGIVGGWIVRGFRNG